MPHGSLTSRVFLEWKTEALSDIEEFRLRSLPTAPYVYTKCQRCLLLCCCIPCMFSPCYIIKYCCSSGHKYQQRGQGIADMCIAHAKRIPQKRKQSLYVRYQDSKAIIQDEMNVNDLREIFQQFFQVFDNVSWKYQMIDWLDKQLTLLGFTYPHNAMTPVRAKFTVKALLDAYEKKHAHIVPSLDFD